MIPSARLSTFARNTIEVVIILAVAYVLFRLMDALLLGFAGLLFAVILDAMTGLLTRHARIGRKPALALVVLVLGGLLAASVVLFGPQLSNQFDAFTQAIPTMIEQAQRALERDPLGRYILEVAGRGGGLAEPSGRLITQLSGAAVTLFDGLLTLVVVLFVGIFFAMDPDLYRRSVLRLFPTPRQERIGEVLDTAAATLKRWLTAILLSMGFVFLATTVGLMIAGVPQALFLGVVAGLLDFVPFIGPIAAAFPGILVGFMISPTVGWYTVIVYFVVQQLEGNVVTPLVQQRAVFLPPAYVILSLMAFGLLFGLLGVLLATPLAAVLMVVIKMLYIEDVLGQDPHLDGK